MAVDAATQLPEEAPPPRRNLTRRFSVWAERSGALNWLVLVLAAAALISGGATYYVLTGSSAFGSDPDVVYWLLVLDLAILLLLVALVARRVVSLWLQARRQQAGARLHGQIVLVFGILASLPAILMTVFAGLFLSVGLQSWFNDKVATAINESVAVARGYLDEHSQTIRADLLAMANDINRERPRLIGNPVGLDRLMRTQTLFRNLNEAVIFDGRGAVIAQAGLSFQFDIQPPSEQDFARASVGAVVLDTEEGEDRVRAMIKLDRFLDSYLMIGRSVDPLVLGHVESTEEAAARYEQLRGRSGDLQVAATLIFMLVGLLLVLAAVWAGLGFAERLVRPIRSLIVAAEKVRSGDLSARALGTASRDELGNLSRAFNRMTRQLAEQRDKLVGANVELNQRRQFIETVLSGVSAGVIGLDAKGQVTVANPSAPQMLGLEETEIIGTDLRKIVPELTELLAASDRRPEEVQEAQIAIAVPGIGQRIYLLRIANDRRFGQAPGYVVTFDDISELLSAQRKAAWADVARRIAHEMKNPLTPIQLAAERLQRRYQPQINKDPDTFIACTDTIIRQVGDIGRMVDEFSAFARMPQAVLKPESLDSICREAVVLQREANRDIAYAMHLPEQPVLARCDRRQIGQALTNLLQNAADAIAARPERFAWDPPCIDLHLFETDDGITVLVADNGRGLPQSGRTELTEPYVTTRAKGTGLGLAIVKKIMEDHDGKLQLADRMVDLEGQGWGALVSLHLPRSLSADSLTAMPDVA